MRGLHYIIVLVILSVTTLVISEEENKEKTEKEVKFKSYYPFGADLGDLQNGNYYEQFPQSPYANYPYYPQTVGNSYVLPEQSYPSYSNTPYYSYPSYYQPYANSQPYYGQYPYASGSSYPSVNYPTSYQGASYPASSYPASSYPASSYPASSYPASSYPSAYPSSSYPVVDNQFASSTSGGQYAGIPTDIIDVDLTKPYDPTFTHQEISNIPQETSSKVVYDDAPYIYLAPQSGVNTKSYPSYKNGYDSFANVPIEYIDVDKNGNRIASKGGYNKPSVTVTSHSTHSGADPIVRTESQVVTMKPIRATITRIMDPNNREEPIRISYVNGERVDGNQEKSEEVISNSIENENEDVNSDEADDEDEEPSNVDGWF